MTKNDEIEKLQEWQEHQYNPDYWVNRFSPFFPPKKTVGMWVLSSLDVILILPVFLISVYLYFTGDSISDLVLIGILGSFSLLAILRFIKMRPGVKLAKNQAELDAIKRKENKEKKKKYPKRRKDYN